MEVEIKTMVGIGIWIFGAARGLLIWDNTETPPLQMCALRIIVCA